MTRLPRLLASVLLAGALVAPIAIAQPQHTEAFTFNFRYDARELETEAGARKLLQRLEKEAMAECRTSARPLQNNTALQRTCVDDAMASAMQNIASPILAQQYDARRRS